MDKVCYISDKYQPPNHLAKHQYFYARDVVSFLHFEKKLALLVLFQVSANFLINQLKNIFTQDTWHCSFTESKSVHSPSQNLLKTSILTPFLLVFTAVEVCNITNKNRSPGNLAKYQYFYKIDLISFLHFGKNWRSPSQKVFETSTFYHIFTIFKSEWGL